ncbi:hypothetical protein N0Y54_29790 [Nostoc punctiforme UO1]|uniref:hypothetical protein n=1 Tax=Nostoc punctiforme TaxID=272131 RepID=UPI0030963226
MTDVELKHFPKRSHISTRLACALGSRISLSQNACLLMLASDTQSGSAIANCTFFPGLPKLRASRAM